MSLKLLYVIFCGVIVAFLTLLHLALNRLRFELRGFVLLLGYGLAASLPVSYATMFPGQVDVLVYLLVAVVVSGPFVTMGVVALIKGRGAPLRSIAGILGFLTMMATPLAGQRFFWIPAGLGAAGMGVYLILHVRQPAVNPMWLRVVLEEAAQSVPRACGYTPKPITVPIRNRAVFVGGTFGFGVYVRRDRTVVWMKRKLHQRLGRPNLEMLAHVVARRIAERDTDKEGTP